MTHKNSGAAENAVECKFRVGVDIGGTFTDLFLLNDATHEFVVGKKLTTPQDPSEAIEAGLREMLAQAKVPAQSIRQIIHGTTLVANALIERKGAPTALLATCGFRDATEIGREQRYELYDLMLEMPQPLVPRHLRFDIPERILADGSIHQELDVAHVERLAHELQLAGVEAVAIAFLNSFINPVHECAARDAVLRMAPNIRVSISSEVAPEIREYDRTSTTVANIYVQGRVEHYLRELGTRMSALGVGGSLLLMLSSGGVATVETAVRFPVRLLESGPAAGVLAAAALGPTVGAGMDQADSLANLLSFDMGGTTAKFAIIDRGQPLISHDFEVDRRYRFRKGSGLPIRTPVIEMIEIGAGGGSIARVNSLGLLKVGPESAGAQPGPACYGRGGSLPTVTDADLILGYLNPDFFLGGGMALDVLGARRAVDEHIAQPLGLSIEQAAWGIHQVVNENMSSAARVHAIERGKDPAGLPVFAFGGAGPVHAFRVAAALGAPSVVIPFGAGVMSAIGFLTAPLAFDFARSWPVKLEGSALDWPRVNGLLGEMQAEGGALLQASGVLPQDISHTRSVEVRYAGQGHEVGVVLPNDLLSAEHFPAIRARFEAEYLRLYSRLGPPVPLEAITWRVVSSSPKPALNLVRSHSNHALASHPDAARKGTRLAYFPEAGGMTETPVYDRYALAKGMCISGPAIIEERESTLIIGSGATAAADERWNLILTYD